MHPSYELFKYFAVLIDASTRYSHVFLSSTCNWLACARLLAQLIQLIAHLDYPIKKSNLGNVGEFTSHAFNEYCMSIGIDVECH